MRERVGVIDLTSFAKYDVTGADAERFLNRLFANRMARRQGGIVLAHMLTDDAMIENESTITRMAMSVVSSSPYFLLEAFSSTLISGWKMSVS